MSTEMSLADTEITVYTEIKNYADDCGTVGAVTIAPRVTPKPLVLLENITKHYRLGEIKIKALKNISLTINHGELVGIFGPSGSGKSTLMNIVGLTDKADSGDLTILGQAVNTLKEGQLAEFRNAHIGYVFQNFNLLPMFSALENVMLPLQIAKTNKRIAKEKSLEMLEQVGLADKQNARPDQLSGGQQQRVAIARALVSTPGLVIADEPTANLDSQSSENIIELIHKLNGSSNTTFLISTHDPRMLNRIKTQFELVDGKITRRTQ